ncbi:MAG: endonuclease/exonuclease/phosphatase family protein [Gammaproteobacteria bacterium]|nr:endonuclease/exonuclease/phosphatase family protein [Gammaproteobacteria bacterium]MCY4218087.1 endonuclease/exonuclease/phosphatase family protein [Gammaproteobacteria bacterium]
MKVVTYNIRFGLGLDHKVDLRRITDTIRDADIIALQEVERFWHRSKMTDQPKLIGELLPSYYWKYFPALDLNASTIHRKGKVNNRRRQFGVMVLSKWPILSSRSLLLPQIPTFFVTGIPTGALECVITTKDTSFRIYCIHLSSASVTERLAQVEAFLNMHEMIKRCGQAVTPDIPCNNPSETKNSTLMDWGNGEKPIPVPDHTLLLGDFNFTDNSTEYVRLLGEPDPAYGYGVNQGSFVDSWLVAKQSSKDSLTWWPDPPDRQPGRPLRIDYCFVNTELAPSILRAWVDVDADGSDHRPYWLELDLNK